MSDDEMKPGHLGMIAGVGDGRYRDLVEGSLEGIFVIDRDDNFLYANQAFAKIHGFENLSELQQLDHASDLLAEEDRQRLGEYWTDRLAGRPVPEKYQYRVRHRDGSLIWLNNTCRAITWQGQPAVQCIVTDISAQMQAEDALRRSEQQYREMIEGSVLGILIFDSQARPLFANQAAADLYGYANAEEIMGLSSVDQLSAAQNIENRLEYQVHHLDVDDLPNLIDFQGRHKSRPPIWLQGHIQVVDWEGTPAIQTTLTDINERKKMQAALAAIDAQLRQTQKLEVVGQLTGGVAHDFNNLLAIIVGNMSMLDEALHDKPELQDLTQRTIAATRRGAELTHHLLAFSRRLPLSPQPTNIDELINGMGDLLHRTLGPEINLRTITNGNTWPCDIDRAQMENVLLNLATNARDAMPDSGILTIATANVHVESGIGTDPNKIAPGDYVAISITDSGHGMERDVMEKAFEPFFTTKDIGQGPGLGLSMAYGFAQQSGGQVTIYSEVGVATTIRIYMPRMTLDQISTFSEGAFEMIPKGRGETILVVEDDTDVRDIAVAQLTGLDYRVLEAGDVDAALRRVSDHPEIALILSDIVMTGGKSGPDLKRHIEGRGHTTPIVFMSGYPQDALEDLGTLEPGLQLLHKPYRMADLANLIRSALDAASQFRLSKH